MDTETKQKISEAVIAILKEADMEEMTEYKVRKQASENLGIDLSEPELKRFVRHVVESYLLEQQSNAESEPAGEAENSAKQVEEPEVEEEEEDDRNKKVHAREYDDDGDLIICRLSNRRKVTIQDFRGKTLVSIREYYTKDGKELPSSKGISLTTDQWSAFSKNVPGIEKAIRKMESRLM